MAWVVWFRPSSNGLLWNGLGLELRSLVPLPLPSVEQGPPSAHAMCLRHQALGCICRGYFFFLGGGEWGGGGGGRTHRARPYKNINIYIYINIHIYTYTTSTSTSTYTHIHIHTHTYMHTYIHPSMHACMHACMHAPIYIYIYSYVLYALHDMNFSLLTYIMKNECGVL